MIRVAIVEDQESDIIILKKILHHFETAEGEMFQITLYHSPLALLEGYRAVYDLIFMDIELPHMNGMEAARKLRKLDTGVLLIFVTKVAKYAIRGYEVGALDYVLKPLEYYSFVPKVRRAIRYINLNAEKYITLNKDRGQRRVSLRYLKYVEVKGHYLTYYTVDEEIVARGKISELEQKLEMENFARCNNCYLVNLHYVTGVHGQILELGSIQLPISRTKQSEFLNRLTLYLGGDIKI